MRPMVLALVAACDAAHPGTLPIDRGPTEPIADLHPGVTVVDLAVQARFQEAFHLGHFARGRACAVADFDLDGRQDIVLGNPSDETFILRNASSGPGDLAFELSTVLIESDGEGTALSWVVQPADYDNDGDFDLLVAMGGTEGVGYNRLFRNELVPTGTLSFVDVAAVAGVLGPMGPEGPQESPNAGIVWLDVDIDGDVDVFVSQRIFPTWLEVTRADWQGYNLFFVNLGDGTFVEAARFLGLTSQENTQHSAAADLDNDGDVDLYENNFGEQQHVWHNQLAERGSVWFTDVTASSALDGGDLRYPLETFVAAAADLNNDGWEDLVGFVRGPPTGGPYVLGHTILLNVEGRGFVDATPFSNLNDPFEPGLGGGGFRNHSLDGVMGCTPTDVTGDGLVDFYIGNGGPENGTLSQLFVARDLVAHEFEGVGTVLVPVYENWSDLVQFPAEEAEELVAEGIEYPPFPYRTHGVCVADFDRDGVREIAVQEGGTYRWGGDISREPNRLFQVRMPTPQAWLAVHPMGDGVTVSRDAIGTRVHAVIEAADGTERHVYETLRGGNAFSASNGFEVFLGLGDARAVRELHVTWPDGGSDLLRDVPLNQVLELAR